MTALLAGIGRTLATLVLGGAPAAAVVIVAAWFSPPRPDPIAALQAKADAFEQLATERENTLARYRDRCQLP